MNSNNHIGVIWTNHALERLVERKLPQDMVLQAFHNPDKEFPGKQPGTTEFIKRFGQPLVTVIATQNENYEWIILSCWIDPPLPGTIDSKKKEEYRKYLKASGLGKLWIVFKQQMRFLVTGKW